MASAHFLGYGPSVPAGRGQKPCLTDRWKTHSRIGGGPGERRETMDPVRCLIVNIGIDHVGF